MSARPSWENILGRQRDYNFKLLAVRDLASKKIVEIALYNGPYSKAPETIKVVIKRVEPGSQNFTNFEGHVLGREDLFVIGKCRLRVVATSDANVTGTLSVSDRGSRLVVLRMVVHSGHPQD